MKNEKGITLVELLAVLAIVGVIAAVIMSVLMTGSNASERTATNQQLQQEGNLIVERIRSNYLENIAPVPGEVVDEDGCLPSQRILLETPSGTDRLLMDGRVISEGYTYSGLTNRVLCRTKPSQFQLIITDGDLSYSVNTSFSKLN